MILTAMFKQLVPSAVSRIYGAFSTVSRTQIPNKAKSLGEFGLDADIVEAMEKSSKSREEEAKMVAGFLLHLYQGESFVARKGLEAWLNRKGGLTAEANRLCCSLASLCRQRDYDFASSC